jgi:hypothetical protein
MRVHMHLYGCAGARECMCARACGHTPRVTWIEDPRDEIGGIASWGHSRVHIGTVGVQDHESG